MKSSSEWTYEQPGWCFLRLAEGQGYWLGKDSPRELSHGDVVVLPPGEQGVFRASMISAVRLEYFIWRPDMLHGLLTLSERHFFSSKTRESIRFFPAASDIAQKYSEASANKSAETNLIERACLLDLVVKLFSEELNRHTPPQTDSGSASERFQRLIQEITESELLNYTPEDLARRCGCSVRHFSRLFQEHFGISVRTKQTRLRLQKASQLLAETDSKIINVALDSGYRNLGLFNTMFKKYLGMTPSEWRNKNSKQKDENKIARVLSVLLSVLFFLVIIPAQAQTNPATSVKSVPEKTTLPNTNNIPHFNVQSYEVEGNTLFPKEMLDLIFENYTGTNVTFETIRSALAELQLAYRGRGFITCSVGLPQQQLTNGIVHVKVTEGRLVEIQITGNRYYSSNNIWAALPSLQTNTLLNSLVFQQELDAANASRDRQIYPEVSPGPEPGTSVLRLRVKDRLPLHGRFDLNNVSTPGTPELRMNASMQYNNLWQLDHQVGMQYNFTPGYWKEDHPLINDFFFDRPLVASYSAFYRAPVNLHNSSTRREVNVGDFGYDEVNHRFRPPPPGDKPEFIAYASRSVSDTDNKLTGPPTTTPVLKPTGGLVVNDRLYSRTIAFNENIGFRWSQSLPDIWKIRSSYSAGLDYKSYHATILQNRIIQAAIFVPRFGSTGPPFDVFQSPPFISSRTIPSSVDYLPFTLNYDGSESDKWGSTSFNLYQSVNFSGLPSGRGEFAAVGSTNSTGNFYVLNAGLSREQKIYDEWTMTLRASGQWANEPLINNEQFGLGGVTGPRGYREGDSYGDTGWRVSIEPHTPLVDIGMVDGDMPMHVRGFVFFDYGEAYSLDSRPATRLCGTGWGFSGTIGQTIDFRFAMATPLISTLNTPLHQIHFYFGLGAQF